MDRATKRKIERIAGRAQDSEKLIEAHLVKRAAEMGGVALKYDNSFDRAYPDRLVLLPGGASGWIEVKSRGCKPTALQEFRHRELRALGQAVYVCDSRQAVDQALAEIKAQALRRTATTITYEQAVYGI